MKAPTLILSFLAIAFVCFDFKGKDLNGTYSDELGIKFIIISADTLKIMTASYDIVDSPFYSSLNCMAICKYKVLSDSFMEINSMDPPDLAALKNISITRSKQFPNDSVQHPIINFVLPNLSEIVKLEVSDYLNHYSVTSNNGRGQIILNKEYDCLTKKIGFSITPTIYYASNLKGQYFGLLDYWYPHEINCQPDDIITIEIPNLTDDLLKQYYIKGEYVRIKSDGLEWRGTCYKKVK